MSSERAEEAKIILERFKECVKAFICLLLRPSVDKIEVNDIVQVINEKELIDLDNIKNVDNCLYPLNVKYCFKVVRKLGIICFLQLLDNGKYYCTEISNLFIQPSKLYIKK
jgi:hypothetical protein